MRTLTSNNLRFLFLACLISLFSVNVAFAHGSGEADGNIQAHLDDYSQEVEAMIDASEEIVEAYKEGDEDAAGQVKDLIEQWESVDIHLAIETQASSLYPPVWAALGGLGKALKKQDALEQVRHWQHRFAVALHEGLGALKLAATIDGHGAGHTGSGHHDSDHHKGNDADDSTTVEVIQDNLDQVVELYEHGKPAEAKELIHSTYMSRFEGIEGPLITQDPELVRALEMAFNATLPQLIDNGASVKEVAAQVDTMNDKLDRAEKLLRKAGKEQSSVF